MSLLPTSVESVQPDQFFSLDKANLTKFSVRVFIHWLWYYVDLLFNVSRCELSARFVCHLDASCDTLQLCFVITRTSSTMYVQPAIACHIRRWISNSTRKIRALFGDSLYPDDILFSGKIKRINVTEIEGVVTYSCDVEMLWYQVDISKFLIEIYHLCFLLPTSWVRL